MRLREIWRLVLNVVRLVVQIRNLVALQVLFVIDLKSILIRNGPLVGREYLLFGDSHIQSLMAFVPMARPVATAALLALMELFNLEDFIFWAINFNERLYLSLWKDF